MPSKDKPNAVCPMSLNVENFTFLAIFKALCEEGGSREVSNAVHSLLPFFMLLLLCCTNTNPLPFQSASSDLEITTIADVIGVYDSLWWGKSFQDLLCKEAPLVGSPQWKRRDFKKEKDSC